MKSNLFLALLGSAGLTIASMGTASAQQSCAELIAQFQGDWTVKEETAAIQPDTAVNPSEDDTQGEGSSTTATMQVYDDAWASGNPELDELMARAYAADAAGDEAACAQILEEARGMM